MNIKLAIATKLTVIAAAALFAGGCASTATQRPAHAGAPTTLRPAPVVAGSYQRFDSSELRVLELPPQAVDFRMETRADAPRSEEAPATAYPMQKASAGHQLRMGFAPLPAAE